jgi:hypothetical protein
MLYPCLLYDDLSWHFCLHDNNLWNIPMSYKGYYILTKNTFRAYNASPLLLVFVWLGLTAYEHNFIIITTYPFDTSSIFAAKFRKQSDPSEALITTK